MFHPISFNLCDNGPLISACGRLKLIEVIYLGLENLFICCEYLCKHQSPWCPWKISWLQWDSLVRCSTNWPVKPHTGSEVNLLSSYLPSQVFLLQACCFTFCKLNSSPIDEVGEGHHHPLCLSKWVVVSSKMRASRRVHRYQPQPREQKPPPGTITLRNSVEILANLYTHKC